MGQFPVTPDRAAILERMPDYEVRMTSADQRVTVHHEGQLIADSTDALLIEETRHADVYYLPRSDVDMSLLTRTDHVTYCPFKGHASYWSLGPDLANLVWSYENPFPEVAAIRDYVSFYSDRVEIRVE
jgi:uncharacterized protein (DUF427 family)